MCWTNVQQISIMRSHSPQRQSPSKNFGETPKVGAIQPSANETSLLVEMVRGISERLGALESTQNRGPRPDERNYSRHTDGDINCAFCGRKGHAKKDCRQRQSEKCTYCSKSGNTFNECFTRQRHMGRGRQNVGFSRSNDYRPRTQDRFRGESNPGGENRYRGRSSPDRDRNLQWEPAPYNNVYRGRSPTPERRQDRHNDYGRSDQSIDSFRPYNTP